MRAVAQRVSSAKVVVDGSTVGEIGAGICLLIGVARGDDEKDAIVLADKVAGLRVFTDDDGKMNRSLADTGGDVLLVSQFTLLGDVRRGRRPSFTEAAAPEEAAPLIELVSRRIGEHGIVVRTGVFGAHMEIALVNDGPVTLLVEVIQGSVV